MPLLTSPIDGSPMRQIQRYGIEFDVCPTTGGIWLDKGELEKLMALLREEAAREPIPYSSRDTSAPRARYDHDDDDDHHRRYSSGGKGDYRRREGKVSRLLDIFDF